MMPSPIAPPMWRRDAGQAYHSAHDRATTWRALTISVLPGGSPLLCTSWPGCPGHPRLACNKIRKMWMLATSAGMTSQRSRPLVLSHGLHQRRLERRAIDLDAGEIHLGDAARVADVVE